MTTAVAAPWLMIGLEPYRFSDADLARLVEEGIVEEGCELLDGVVTLDGEPCRFSVEQYERMLRMPSLFLRTMELLDGLLFPRMPMNPLHAIALQRLWKRLFGLVPGGWTLRTQVDVALPTSRPLPDVTVARGDDDDYATRHPGPDDLGLLAEVSDWTLSYDRNGKRELYARAGIAVYWIVNLIDRQVEVMTRPVGDRYADQRAYRPGDNVPFHLDGALVGSVAVDDILPAAPGLGETP
ncbi:MAG: Uma2 family endonuclease [Gemmataceae bacterium]|nr:Uma2 family endonuclease [Gemmataceae bacterium]